MRFRREVTAAVLMSILYLFPTACKQVEPRFEEKDSEGYLRKPLLKLVSVIGKRDGDSVKAQIRFAASEPEPGRRFIDGLDSVQIDILLHLGPPAQFVSGTYSLMIRGESSEGTVECPSLNYLGGQADVPSVGGVFTLIHHNVDIYGKPFAGEVARVTLPTTPIQRSLRP